ncbi:hypothetical protein RLOatenuis_7990 [Rickettsiales bacterium]|nr:hypothetical protein RLOatenuis_7990 [Rickettsiales bacterium]
MASPFKFLSFSNLFSGKKDASTKGVLPEDSNLAELEAREIGAGDLNALRYLDSILQRDQHALQEGNAQFTTHATKQELKQLERYIKKGKIKPNQLSAEIAGRIFTYDPKIAKLFMQNGLDPNAMPPSWGGRYLSGTTANAARPNLLVLLNSARLEKNFDISADISQDLNPALLGLICGGAQKQGYIIPFIMEKCGVDLKHKYQYGTNSETLVELTTFTGSASAIEALVRGGGEVTTHFVKNAVSKNADQKHMGGRKLMQPQALLNMAVYERIKRAAMESAQHYPKRSAPSKFRRNHRGTDKHLDIAVEECLFEEVNVLANAAGKTLSSALLRNRAKEIQRAIVQNNHVHVYRIILMLDELRENGADTEVIELLKEACQTENSQEYRDVLLQYLLNWALQERFESWVKNNPGQEAEFDQMGNLREIVVENELLEGVIESGNAALVEYLTESTGIEIGWEELELAQDCVDEMPVKEQQFSDKRMQLIADFADMYDSHLKKNLDFIAQATDQKALNNLYKMLHENWDWFAEYYKSSNSPQGVLEVIQEKLWQQQVREVLQNPKEEWLDIALQDLSDIIKDTTETALEDRKNVGNWLAKLQDSKADLPLILEQMQNDFLNMADEINDKITHLKFFAEQYKELILSKGQSTDSKLINDVYENVKQAIALVKVNHCKPLADLIDLVQSRQDKLIPREKPEAAMLPEGQQRYDDLYMDMSGLAPNETVTEQQQQQKQQQQEKKEVHYDVPEPPEVLQHRKALEALGNAKRGIVKLEFAMQRSVSSLKKPQHQSRAEEMKNLVGQATKVELSLYDLHAAILPLKTPKDDPLITKVHEYAKVLSNTASNLGQLLPGILCEDCAKILDGISLNLHNLEQEAKTRVLTEQLTDPAQQIGKKLEAIQDFILSAQETASERAHDLLESYEQSYNSSRAMLQHQNIPKLKLNIAAHRASQKRITASITAAHRALQKSKMDFLTAKSDALLYHQISIYMLLILDETHKYEDKDKGIAEAILKDIEELVYNKITQEHLLEDPESLLKSLDDLVLKHNVLTDRAIRMMPSFLKNDEKNTNFADDVREPDEMRDLKKKVRLVRQMAKLAPQEKNFYTNVADAHWELKTDTERKSQSLERDIEQECQTGLKKIYKDLGSDLPLMLNIKLNKRSKKMIEIKRYEKSLERFPAADELTSLQREQKKAITENLEEARAELRAVEEKREGLPQEEQMKLEEKDKKIKQQLEEEMKKSGEELQKKWEENEIKMITELDERAEKKEDKFVETEIKDLKKFLSKVDMRCALKDAIDQATDITKQCKSEQQSSAMKSDISVLSEQILSKLDNVLVQLTECSQNVKSFKKGALDLSAEDCKKMANFMKKIPIKELETLKVCLKIGLYTSVDTVLDEIGKNLSSALELIPDRSSDFRPKATAETVRYGPAVDEQLKQVVAEVSKVGGIDLKEPVVEYDLVGPPGLPSKTELPASAKRGGSEPPNYPPPPPPTGRGL